jgi:hypothetical protein
MIQLGDLFEWVKYYDIVYRDEEQLYSFAMKQYVYVGGLCLCIGVNNVGTLYWMSKHGLFHVNMIQYEMIESRRYDFSTHDSLPRKIKT